MSYLEEQEGKMTVVVVMDCVMCNLRIRASYILKYMHAYK